MTDTPTNSAFRIHILRLAWLMSLPIFAVVLLMWVSGHDANGILAEIGFGLFLAAGLFSILARRFTPFAWALFAAILLSGSICA